MKIGLVIGAYNDRGGLERVAVETARGLRDLGHRVVVITQQIDSNDNDRGIEFIRVGGFKKNLALRAATFPAKATRAVGDLDLDVIYSFGSSVMVPAVVRAPGAHRSWWTLANREWPANSIEGARRRLNPHHRITLGLDAIVLGHAMPHAVLAAGEWAAEEIRTFYPRIADRVDVLPDGVNLEEFRFSPEGRDAKQAAWKTGPGPVLLSVATELRRKGLGTLCESFRLIREELPTAVLVIGGRAPAADIRALVAQHHVSDGVRVVGEIDDMAAAYSAADALVFPTRFDPWGLPVVESLACGTPVAVSARAGAAQAVTPGVSGALITDPTDPAQVAQATIDALYATGSRAEIRESVYDFAWPRVVERLEKFLREASR
jgi:UDP-glucose:(heptosyl)LPS alpha-1,3-glucosyltransferase